MSAAKKFGLWICFNRSYDRQKAPILGTKKGDLSPLLLEAPIVRVVATDLFFTKPACWTAFPR